MKTRAKWRAIISILTADSTAFLTVILHPWISVTFTLNSPSGAVGNVGVQTANR